MDIFEIIQEALLWICLMIDSAVYSFIGYVYQIILVLARINVFDDTSVIDGLVNRVYIIIGVVMLFLLAYSLLKGLINPDEALKGKNSPPKIIFNIIISIVLIAFVPTIFNIATGFQNAILEQGTLTGIIIGSDGSSDSAQSIEDGGFNIAAGVFQAFFHPKVETEEGVRYCQYFVNSNPGNDDITTTEVNDTDCTEFTFSNGLTYSEFWQAMKSANSFELLPSINTDIIGNIDYTWIISTIAGAFVVFVLISYCIEIAIRALKLAAFQLIAPIPILARIIPGEQGNKVFSNWIKACLSTYLEVFIRLGILFFIIVMISALQRNIGGIFATFETESGSLGIAFLAWAFLIIGLIFFVKDFPNILKEVTGLDSGKYGKAVVRGLGMMGATFGGGATSAIRRTVADKKEHPEMGKGQRVARTLSALGGGMKRGLWQGGKVEKINDIPKYAGKAATATLGHRADMDAAIASAGGNKLKGTIEYYEQKRKNVATNVGAWASGSFEAQQQMLNEINEFLKDAKSVKSESEGIVRDKKYLFTMGQRTYRYGVNNNKTLNVNSSTSLSEIEAIIETLKSSGNIEDAQFADKLNNDLQLRIKDIGKELSKSSVEISSTNDDSTRQNISNNFSAQFMTPTSKGLIGEISPSIAKINSAYEIVNRKAKENSSLDAVINFKKEKGDLSPDNVSALADQLEISSAEIQQNIKLEQERRKAANPKGGKDK